MAAQHMHPRDFLSYDTLCILNAGHVCWYCLRSFVDMATGKKRFEQNRCSGCKRAWYCSTECQNEDWQIGHKILCMAFREANKRDRMMGHDASATREKQILYRDICANAFSKPSDKCEYGTFPLGFIFNEIKCTVCLRTPFQSATYHNMTPCPTCKLAWWCSPECAEGFYQFHTPRRCAHMHDVGAVEHVTTAYALARQSRRQFTLRTEQPRSSHLSLSSLRGWAEYGHLFPDFDRLVHESAKQFRHAHPDAEKAIAIMAKEEASVTLTILAALEDTIPDLAQKKRLCVHVVGAAHRELSCTRLMEEFLHFLPDLQDIVVVYAGPSVEPPAPGRGQSNLACAECQYRGRSRTSVSRVGPYADADESHPPDLIAVLNSGFTEMQTAGWQSSLEVILDSGRPAVFTAESRIEAEWEEKALRDMGARVIQDVELNKWRGLSPTCPRERSIVEGIVYTYSSQYRLIVQGRVGQDGVSLT